ncbi:MAG: S1 RNA-binding domain-containing protein [Candidatus Solibacter usitatus]|nr:S1 RNA-binding domain-containing protein [Candidatus Solibacter usitatus]
MSFPNPTDPVLDEVTPEKSEFGDILTQFEQEHKDQKAKDASQSLQGTVVSISPDGVVVDIGRKMEGILEPPAVEQAGGAQAFQKGDLLSVVVTGRNEQGYYQLSVLRVKRPTDWTGFEKALADKAVIAGVVLETVKGGLRVDVGVRAFLPASRSGARDIAEMEKLVGQEIQCRITKLDIDSEDVVVDRRGVLEEIAAIKKEEAFRSLVEGSVMNGTVRSVMDFGAFIDLGGVDGLLHVTDMSWNRVGKPSDVVSQGELVEVKILKIDASTHKISLGMKQLQPDPWAQAVATINVGDRIKGKVVRLADFGAFVEIQPGVDGLIHISSLSWGKRIQKPSDVLKAGDVVEAVVLEVKPTEKRIALGLKEALGDPWEGIEKRFPVGSVLTDVVVNNLAKFGAFIDLADGVEGMIHIADITSEKRLEHPKEVLSTGQKVRVKVIEVDKEKRRIRLGMKQLEPIHVEGGVAKVEIGEGVLGVCRLPKREPVKQAEAAAKPAVDIASLSAMLSNRWKQGPAPVAGAPEQVQRGEVRSFRICALDAERQSVELALE